MMLRNIGKHERALVRYLEPQAREPADLRRCMNLVRICDSLIVDVKHDRSVKHDKAVAWR
jgi:hypothetical protein